MPHAQLSMFAMQQLAAWQRRLLRDASDAPVLQQHPLACSAWFCCLLADLPGSCASGVVCLDTCMAVRRERAQVCLAMILRL
jgi:hypothetical protein